MSGCAALDLLAKGDACVWLYGTSHLGEKKRLQPYSSATSSAECVPAVAEYLQEGRATRAAANEVIDAHMA